MKWKEFFSDIKRIVGSYRGTTLIEVMIAAGLSSVVALAVMRMHERGMKGIRKIETDSSLRYFVDNRIRRPLSDPLNCKINFGVDAIADATAAGGNTLDPFTLVEVVDPNAQCDSHHECPQYSYCHAASNRCVAMGATCSSAGLLAMGNTDDATCPCYSCDGAAWSCTTACGANAAFAQPTANIFTLQAAAPAVGAITLLDESGGRHEADQDWYVSDVYMGEFIPNTANSLVGTCPLEITFTRRAYRTASGKITSFGSEQKRIDLDLYCRLKDFLGNADSNSIQNCVISTAINEGVWSKNYNDDKVFINYNDAPGGFVTIGQNPGVIPQAPLTIFSNPAIWKGSPLFRRGIELYKDSVYSWRSGDWAITESGGANSCLNLLAFYYDETTPSDSAIWPYMRFCDDKNYLKGGIRIQGTLGTADEPADLILQNGSFLGGDVFETPTSGVNNFVVGTQTYLGSGDVPTSNSFVAGAGHQVRGGDYSLVLGRGNELNEDGTAWSGMVFNAVTHDDVNMVIGGTNYVDYVFNSVLGFENYVRYKESAVLGHQNYLSNTSGWGLSSIVGNNNQVTAPSFNNYVFGNNNFVQQNGIAIGAFGLVNHPGSIVFSNGPVGTVNGTDHYSSSRQNEVSLFAKNSFRLSTSYDETNPNYEYRDVLLFGDNMQWKAPSTPAGYPGMTDSSNAGGLNHGYTDTNNTYFNSGQDKSDTPVPYNSAIMASRDSNNFAATSAIIASGNSNLWTNNHPTAKDNIYSAIIGSNESELQIRDAGIMMSTYKSKITADNHLAWQTGILGGGEHQANGQSLIIGGSSNTAVNFSLAGSDERTTMIGGIENRFMSSTTSATAPYLDSGLWIGGYQNRYYNLTVGSHAGNVQFIGGEQNTAVGNKFSSMIGGVRNYMGTYCHYCLMMGGYNNSMGGTNGMDDFNVMLGGRDNVIPAGGSVRHYIMFARGVTAPANTHGNMILTDYTTNGLTIKTAANRQNRMYMRFGNGYQFHYEDDLVTWPGAYRNMVAGFPGWVLASSRDLKHKVDDFNPNEFYSSLLDFEIYKWTYKNSDAYHLSPFAEDFYHHLKLGVDDKMVGDTSLGSATFAATKSVGHKVRETSRKIAKIDEKSSLLDQLVSKVKSYLEKLMNLVKEHLGKLVGMEKDVNELKSSQLDSDICKLNPNANLCRKRKE